MNYRYIALTIYSVNLLLLTGVWGVVMRNAIAYPTQQ